MMVAKGKVIERKYIGSDFQEVCELPNLIGVQLDSYERFLQLDRISESSLTAMRDSFSSTGSEKGFSPIPRQVSSTYSGTPSRSPAPMVT